MFDNVYLNSLVIILVVCILFIISSFLINYLLMKKTTSDKNEYDLRESSIFLKYNLRTKKIIIDEANNKDEEITNAIYEFAKTDGFFKDIEKARKSDNPVFEYLLPLNKYEKRFVFEYRHTYGSNAIYRVDIMNILKNNGVILKTIDDLRIEHALAKSKKATFYYINIKNFTALNERFGRLYGDYILDVIKNRIHSIEYKNSSSCYVGSDQYAIYVNKNLSKKKAIRFAKKIVSELTKPINEKYIMIDILIGVGICSGEYNNFDTYINNSFVAAEYAKNRQNYNIIYYTDSMKSEENITIACQKELDKLLDGEIKVKYDPVYNPKKNKYIGYICSTEFSLKEITLDKVKQIAAQQDNVNEMMNNIYKKEFLSFMKRRPSKQSIVVIHARLEDLATLHDVYFQERAFQECKLILFLDVKKGYELINKFFNISNNLNKLLNDGVKLAVNINYYSRFDYDYILRLADYLVVDKSIINVDKNSIDENKIKDMIELANTYDLKLFATNVDEYLQFECILKYGVDYISGKYMGNSADSPTEIEYTKTRLLSKIIGDSKSKK